MRWSNYLDHVYTAPTVTLSVVLSLPKGLSKGDGFAELISGDDSDLAWGASFDKLRMLA